MNTGTKIRTVLAIATCLNTGLLATDVAQFGNETVDTIYRIVSVILNFVIVACVTWFNNDFTEQASEGTGYTRMLKAVEKGEEIGVNVDGLDYLEDGDEDE